MAVSSNRSKYPKLAYSRDVPDTTRALLSKLVTSPDQSHRQKGPGTQIVLSKDTLEKVSAHAGQDMVDSTTVFQMLPDVELAKQILVGAILSPRDLSVADINIGVEEGQFDSELARPLLDVVETYFKQVYKIDGQLDDILTEILFTKGAHVLAILPENNLDAIINGQGRLSMESYRQVVDRISSGRPLGILGHPTDTHVSMEAYSQLRSPPVSGVVRLNREPVRATLRGVQVSDNFELLKAPLARQKARASRLGQLLYKHTVSMETAAKALKPEDIEKLYRRPNETHIPTQVVTPQAYMERPSVGHPLVLTLPMESVIPVHVPGNPSEHIGYFLLLDQNGHPITRNTHRDYYGELRNGFRGNNQDNSSDMVKKVKEAFGGVEIRQDVELEQIQNAYTTILENDLINRLQNGIYGESFEVGASEEIYRIMLYRTLKAQKTQLVYIPAELMVYMAFSYNEHGVGETLLTQSKILSSMRSVLLFAETMAAVRSAVGRKRVNINIDPDDTDPERSISDIQSLIMESASHAFPVASPDPAMTIDYLNRAGFDFSINIEGDNYPNTKVEFDDFQTTPAGGNQELSDRLRRMHVSGFGLTPEMVDPTQPPELAVSVVNNNLMMMRRVMRYQQRFTPFLTKLVQVFTRNSSILRAELQEVLTSNKAKLNPDQKKLETDDVIEEFIDALKVSLPSPDTSKLEQQLAAFEQYTNLLDRALEAYITPDLFPAELLEREPDTIQHITAIVRAYYQRVWLSANNVMPELDQLTEMDGKKPYFSLLDIQQAQFTSLGEAIHTYIEGIEKQGRAWKKKYGEPEGEEGGFGEDGSGSTSDDTYDGGDDFGMDESGSVGLDEMSDSEDVESDDIDTDEDLDLGDTEMDEEILDEEETEEEEVMEVEESSEEEEETQEVELNLGDVEEEEPKGESKPAPSRKKKRK